MKTNIFVKYIFTMVVLVFSLPLFTFGEEKVVTASIDNSSQETIIPKIATLPISPEIYEHLGLIAKCALVIETESMETVRGASGLTEVTFSPHGLNKKPFFRPQERLVRIPTNFDEEEHKVVDMGSQKVVYEIACMGVVHLSGALTPRNKARIIYIHDAMGEIKRVIRKDVLWYAWKVSMSSPNELDLYVLSLKNE